ncbi:unannotated protein [freshwater metagenome]|uniref:Unannotated protein n=1 Tax=freshwater metagenome TaxID=449393 RepID=A0A6J6I126_9ZZZZ
MAAQPERTSAAAAATAAILVIFLSNCVVPFDLPTGQSNTFFSEASISTELTNSFTRKKSVYLVKNERTEKPN